MLKIFGIQYILELDNLKRFAFSCVEKIGSPPLVLLSLRPCCLTSRKHASGRCKTVQYASRWCNMTSKYIQDHSRMRFRISLPLTIGFSLSTAKSCRTGAICRTYRRLCSSCVSTLSSGQLGALSQCAGFSTDVPDRLSQKRSHLIHLLPINIPST